MLSSHKGAVTCLATISIISDDGKDPVITTLIASASADSAVCIWERPNADGTEVHNVCPFSIFFFFLWQLNSLYYKQFLSVVVL